ncbi:MAG: DUF1802 family protein [Actinomycetes bacterium]
MVPAYKEWGVVVRALLAGEQVLDVRKGGSREEGRHFGVRSTRLWLYPTVEHQRPELLKPAYRQWVEESVAAAPADRAIRIEGWADITGIATVTDPAVLDALDSRFIWTTEYAGSRLQWRSRDPLWVLALRVHVLDEPVTVPFRDAYGGCTSWVDLDRLPADPADLPSQPAVSDAAYTSRVAAIADAIPGGLEAPVV